MVLCCHGIVSDQVSVFGPDQDKIKRLILRGKIISKPFDIENTQVSRTRTRVLASGLPLSISPARPVLSVRPDLINEKHHMFVLTAKPTEVRQFRRLRGFSRTAHVGMYARDPVSLPFTFFISYITRAPVLKGYGFVLFWSKTGTNLNHFV